MRHVALRLIGASLAMACFATPVLAAANDGLAPADEYFGHYHMSVLGIRNALNDFSTRANNDPDHASSMLGGIELTEDAVRAWSVRYPHDPMLPKTMLSLERLYLQIGGPDGSAHAQDTVTWFDTILPDDPYTKMAHTLVTPPDSQPAQTASVMPVSDDGTPVTADTPEVQGMVPGLTASTLPPTADEAASQDGVAVDPYGP